MRRTVFAIERDAEPEEQGKVVIADMELSRRLAEQRAWEMEVAEGRRYRVVQLEVEASEC